MLRSKLGLSAEGDIKDDAALRPSPENQCPMPLAITPFSKPLARVGEENDAFVSREIMNSNQCGWMLDKERMLTQLRTAERLLCNKMPSNARDNPQVGYCSLSTLALISNVVF